MAIEIFENAVNSAIVYLERKEEFRKKHSKARSLKEDVMKRFYDISTNGNKPVLLEKITLDRIINKHGNNGLIIVSANRTDMPKERNEEKTRELITDLRNSGYSYLPVYGGYKSPDGVEDEYEPSFLVFNHTTDGENGDFEDLKKLALYLCGKYEQHSVCVKEPNKPPVYLNKNGEKENKRESNIVYKNDAKQQAFTSLKSKEAVDKEMKEKLIAKYKSYCHKNNLPLTKDGFEQFYNEHLNDVERIGRRWTYDISFDECYVNPMPCQLTERLCRVGEIMIWE